MTRKARTTLLIDDAVLVENNGIARARERTLTEVVSEALAEYAVRQRSQSLPSFTGVGASRGAGKVSEEAEDVLGADIDRREGW